MCPNDHANLTDLQNDIDRDLRRLSDDMVRARIEGDVRTYSAVKHRREGLMLALDSVHRRMVGAQGAVA